MVKDLSKILSRVKIQSFSTKSHITIESLSLFEIVRSYVSSFRRNWPKKLRSCRKNAVRTPELDPWSPLDKGPTERLKILDESSIVSERYGCFQLGWICICVIFQEKACLYGLYIDFPQYIHIIFIYNIYT